MRPRAVPYSFHTLNCSNGTFAVAVMRPDEDISVYSGFWRTDGVTMINVGQVKRVFDRQSLRLLSETPEIFTNVYHIAELTASRYVYEWRGEPPRRFIAERPKAGEGLPRAWFEGIICDGHATS